MATLYLPDGTAKEIHPTNPAKGLTGEDFHRLLPDADALDFIYLNSGRALVVDDLGQRKKLPVNHAATWLYQQSGGIYNVYGPALLCHLSNPGLENERWT